MTELEISGGVKSKKSDNETAPRKETKISKFTVTDLIPDIPKQYRDYAPTTLTKQKCTFELHGNLGIANGIRRTICSELPVKSMYFDRADFKTTDDFLIIDMIEQRIACIPILQSIDNHAIFSINVRNGTKTTMEVKSSDITIVSGTRKIPFNDTFVWCVLQPGKTFAIKRIYIREGYGYDDAGAYTMAFSTFCKPLDQIPRIIFHKMDLDGVPASVSNPQHHLIGFSTNGVLMPKEIVTRALESIITRLGNANTAINEEVAASAANIETTFVISDETDTLGNAITHEIYELFPDATFTYRVHEQIRKLYLRMRTDGDPNAMVNAAIASLIKKFNSLLASL